MASVILDGRNGRNGWRIRFYVNKRRRELYFRGRKKDAQELGRKCDALASIQAAGLLPDTELKVWLNKLDGSIREPLVRWGLCEGVSPKLATDKGRLLGPFLHDCIDNRKDIAPNTRKNLKQATRVMCEYFGEKKLLRSISSAEGLRWQRWMHTERELSVATVSMHTKKIKTLLKYAVDDGLIPSNPFASLRGGKESNTQRQRFINREKSNKILEACPGPQWRLIFVLCRYAGLRCPSEVLGLKWTDLDWDRGSIRIDSPKTGLRFVPMFPEVQVALQEAYDAASTGSTRCIDEYPADTTNLRTQFIRILKVAGIEPWPRVFHNLRASRRTELQEVLPDHAINKWLGQSSRVAEEHYITVHDEHWERALNLNESRPPARPPIVSHLDTILNHQECDNPNVLRGSDGCSIPAKYPRRGSNPQPSASEA